MSLRLSLHWRLIGSAWLQALGLGVLLLVLLQLHNERNLRAQLDRTLETEADEVITVLSQLERLLPIEQFFDVETNYRFSQDAYFYQISDERGRALVRSANLGGADLPRPAAWWRGVFDDGIDLASLPHPLAPGERLRVRSEWVELELPGGAAQWVLIQTAASLRELEAAIYGALGQDALVAAAALVAVFFLLRLLTSRALQPVAVMTRKASEITARNLRERLPVTGSGDELDELARVINLMLDRLAISLRRTEAFSSDASHQLRTRLTRIRGEIDLMLRSSAAESIREALEATRDEVAELSRLCSRLLLLARLDQHLGAADAGRIDAIKLDEEVDLNALVAELVEQLTPLALELGVELRHVPAPGVHVRGNRGLLVEALMNLLDNAIHFSQIVGGKVSVSVDRVGAEARASVIDSGPGIPAPERARIFERFYRGPGASAEGGGSGLGLAIVRRIAEAHCGRVEVDDAPGERGSVFHLVLPLGEA